MKLGLSSSLSEFEKPPPKKNPNCTIVEAIEAKKLASVMIATSRLTMWVISWASTPSSSAGLSRFRIPVVAQTVACFCERPIANALGMSVWATAIRGFGMSAWMQSRSIIACSSGASAGDTSRAPIARSAILSDAKYWTENSTAANRAIATAPPPAAKITPAKTT